MTPDDIARLRALAAAATPGPWKADYSNDDYSEEYVFTTGALPADGVRCVVGSEWHNGFNLLLREHDAAFIAAAREALPAALDEIERLRAALTEIAKPRAEAPGLALYIVLDIARRALEVSRG